MSSTQTQARPRTVTPLIAAHVVAHHIVGDNTLGVEPSPRIYARITSIAKADEVERTKLQKKYPGYVAAVLAAKGGEWGIDWLRELAREAGE